MAATLAAVTGGGPFGIAPGLGCRFFTLTFDSSYPTNGEVVDLSSYFSTVLGIEVVSTSSTALEAVKPRLGAAATTNYFILMSGAAEAANASDQSATSCRICVFGKVT